jgi:hypothetical protein
MKVAIFLSGQPRLIDKSLFIHLDTLNIKYDIYIHYWENFKTYSPNTCGNIDLNKNKLLRNKDLKNILIKYYNPKKIKSEKEPKIKFSNRYDGVDPNVNTKIPQLCSLGIKKAFQLCENVNEYDWLIKSRFDLVFPIESNNQPRCDMPYVYSIDERKKYLNNNLKIDFSNCNPDKINFPDLYSPFQPISELWILKPKNKIIFNYYDYLEHCGNHPANEAILGKFCKYKNINLNSMGIRIGINRMYNNKEYLYD